MSSRRPATLVLVTAAACCALFVALCIPFLTRQREIVAAVPSPRAIFAVSLVAVAPHKQLCISSVTIPPQARQLRFVVGTYGNPGPPLLVTLRAGDYRDRLVVAGGYADNLQQSLAMTPPAQARLGSVCIADRGATAIALTATDEARTASRPVGRIDGKVVAGDVYLAFYERGTASVLQRTHQIVEHMSAFRPGVVGPGVLWALVAFVLVGIPAGLLLAVLSAERERRG